MVVREHGRPERKKKEERRERGKNKNNRRTTKRVQRKKEKSHLLSVTVDMFAGDGGGSTTWPGVPGLHATEQGVRPTTAGTPGWASNSSVSSGPYTSLLTLRRRLCVNPTCDNFPRVVVHVGMCVTYTCVCLCCGCRILCACLRVCVFIVFTTYTDLLRTGAEAA